MTYDSRCSLQRQRKPVWFAAGRVLYTVPDRGVFGRRCGSTPPARPTLVSAAAYVALITSLCAAAGVQAWGDEPLCMARPIDRREETRLGLSESLSCLPGDVPGSAGPLWTAPITAAEARLALDESERLAQDGRLADALLKLRVVEHALPRIGDRIALRRAQLLQRLGLPQDALEAFREAETSPERNIAAQARLGAVRCMLDAGLRQGESELDKACKRYPLMSERGSLQLALARAKESWNNRTGAAAIYRSIDLHEPQSAAAEAARASLTRLRASGIAVKPYSHPELLERTERIVRTGTFESAREAVETLCEDRHLPAAVRGRAHALAARIARIEGSWDAAREEIRIALALGVPAGEALRYMPRDLPEPRDEQEAARLREQGESKLRKLVGQAPYRRGRALQLKAALDVAVQYELADAATELLLALRVNKQAHPELRFQSAILASGLASDEAVESTFATLISSPQHRTAARYHRARALERLGRLTEAKAEFALVQQLDPTETRYYAMWAGARLSELDGHVDSRSRCAGSDDDLAECPVETQDDDAGSSPLAAADDDPPPAAVDPVWRESRRQAIRLKLAPLIEVHGAAYPWLARADDLVQLDLFHDAADEINEAYLAYRDARGHSRLRAGVDAVLTGALPPRLVAPTQVRRERLALGPIARGELSLVADLLGDPGVSLRLRDETRELRPRAYAELVEAAAEKYGVDPNLLFAVMRVESIYHRKIVSHAGAVGLMQIMPRTGMLISRELGIEDFDVIDLLNPRTNLEFAAWYLGSLIKRFDGRLPLAIASYNGGPHNVRLWMSSYPSNMPLDAFLERIPFTETHRYVRRVLTHYAAYRAQKNLPMAQLSVSLPEHKPDTVAF